MLPLGLLFHGGGDTLKFSNTTTYGKLLFWILHEKVNIYRKHFSLKCNYQKLQWRRKGGDLILRNKIKQVLKEPFFKKIANKSVSENSCKSEVPSFFFHVLFLYIALRYCYHYFNNLTTYFRYRDSPPVEVVVEPGKVTVHNFTLEEEKGTFLKKAFNFVNYFLLRVP